MTVDGVTFSHTDIDRLKTERLVSLTSEMMDVARQYADAAGARVLYVKRLANNSQGPQPYMTRTHATMEGASSAAPATSTGNTVSIFPKKIKTHLQVSATLVIGMKED